MFDFKDPVQEEKKEVIQEEEFQKQEEGEEIILDDEVILKPENAVSEEKKEVAQDEKSEKEEIKQEELEKQEVDQVIPVLQEQPNNALTPKEEMNLIFSAIWSHADMDTRNFIKEIWETITQSADVVKWEPVKTKRNEEEYQLVLKKEVTGTYSKFYMSVGSIILKQNMRITFRETRNSDNSMIQIITFPDQGISGSALYGAVKDKINCLYFFKSEGSLYCQAKTINNRTETLSLDGFKNKVLPKIKEMTWK